jgi:hypothetical protein
MAEKHLSNDELSAYIDGESRHPEMLAGHIGSCLDCARRHAELARLSRRLRELPAPDVHPAFLTRVVARAAEAEPESGRRWLAFLPAGAGALALVLVAAAWTILRLTAEPVNPPVAVLPASWSEDLDADRLTEFLAWQMAEDSDGMQALATPWTEPVVPQETTGEMLAELAQSDWFDSFASEVSADQEVDELLATLTPTETEALKELLSWYANEG